MGKWLRGEYNVGSEVAELGHEAVDLLLRIRKLSVSSCASTQPKAACSYHGAASCPY